MNKNKIIKWSLGIILVIVSLMSIYSFCTLFGFVKLCTHVKCLEYAEGNEWIALNCVANETINDFSCTFEWEGRQYIDIPLKLVQEKIPDIKSCKMAVCASEFLGKGTNVKKSKEQTDSILKRMEVRE